MIESQPSDTYTQFQGYPPNGNPPPPIIATASPQDLPALRAQWQVELKDKLGVPAALDNLTGFEDQNFIRVDDG